jgi:septal ring-binding cell division protein DamX
MHNPAQNENNNLEKSPGKTDSPSKIRPFWQKHSVKIISWSLLIILCYALWQSNHKHKTITVNQKPLIPVASPINKTTADNPFDTTKPQTTTPKTVSNNKTEQERAFNLATKKTKGARHIKTKAITTTSKQKITKPQTTYALQFSSSHNKKAITSLQQQLNLPGSYIKEVIQQQEVRFVLLSGQYKSIAEAKDALNKLPSAAKKQGPWVRSIIS